MRAARVTVVVPCVCVCVCVCLFVVFCHRYRYVRVHSDTEKTFIIVIFAKNASFRSYGVICLPRMPLTTPEPQNTDTNGIHATWARHYYFTILTKNASFRSYGTFAYLLRAHIRNINMCRYIASASARGRELSGRVRADAYNFAV